MSYARDVLIEMEDENIRLIRENRQLKKRILELENKNIALREKLEKGGN